MLEINNGHSSHADCLKIEDIETTKKAIEISNTKASETLDLVWLNLYSMLQPEVALKTLKMIYLQEINVDSMLNSKQIYFFEQLFLYPQEYGHILEEAAGFLKVVFEQEPKNVELFIESHFFEILWKIIPDYGSAMLIGYLADASATITRKLLDNDVIGIIEHNLSIENNNIQHILFLSSIVGCDINYEDQIIQLAPKLMMITVNQDISMKIRVAALSALASHAKTSEKICEFILKSDFYSLMIEPTSDQYYHDALIELLSATMKYPSLNSINALEEKLLYVLPSLESNDTYTVYYAIEFIKNGSNLGTIFTQCCINLEVVQKLFYLANSDFDMHLKSLIFDTICSLFCQSDVEQMKFFFQYNFLDYFTDHISVFLRTCSLCCLCICNVISSLIQIIEQNLYEGILDYLIDTPEILEAIEHMTNSEDSEVKFSSIHIQEVLNSILNN